MKKNSHYELLTRDGTILIENIPTLREACTTWANTHEELKKMKPRGRPRKLIIRKVTSQKVLYG
jgi:hypothetical protein